MALYFVSIEREEFTWDDFMDEPFETDVELTRNDIYTMAWKIGVMKEDFRNEEVQKLLVFIRNHCERNELPLIEWLKVQRRVWNFVKVYYRRSNINLSLKLSLNYSWIWLFLLSGFNPSKKWETQRWLKLWNSNNSWRSCGEWSLIRTS